MQTFIDALGRLVSPDGELLQIVWTTLQMSFASTLISCVIGMPLGVLLGSRRFRGRRLLLRITHTLMGLPPVVAGLLVFMLLSRKGALGSLGLLFSIPAMVIAQVVLITPIIAGLSASHVSARVPLMLETTRGMGIRGFREIGLLLYECKAQLVSVLLTGYGRAISEVGAVMLVGGNIQYKTRVMTTAIMLETNKGNFELAIALGILLLLIAFAVNSIAHSLQEGFHDRA
ncbi:MAG: ABC transporter permease [Bacillota bacterium]